MYWDVKLKAKLYPFTLLFLLSVMYYGIMKYKYAIKQLFQNYERTEFTKKGERNLKIGYEEFNTIVEEIE